MEVPQSRFVSHLTSGVVAACLNPPENHCSRQLPPFLLLINVNLAEVVWSDLFSFQMASFLCAGLGWNVERTQGGESYSPLL